MTGRVFTIVVGIIGGIAAIVWNKALADREYQRRMVGKTGWGGRPVSPEKIRLFLRWLYVIVGIIFLSAGLRALLWPQ